MQLFLTKNLKIIIMSSKWMHTKYFKQYNLTKSSKSSASIAKSNKQWVGTCLYQKGYKPLLINCEAVIRLWICKSKKIINIQIQKVER